MIDLKMLYTIISSVKREGKDEIMFWHSSQSGYTTDFSEALITDKPHPDYARISNVTQWKNYEHCVISLSNLFAGSNVNIKKRIPKKR